MHDARLEPGVSIWGMHDARPDPGFSPDFCMTQDLTPDFL